MLAALIRSFDTGHVVLTGVGIADGSRVKNDIWAFLIPDHQYREIGHDIMVELRNMFQY